MWRYGHHAKDYLREKINAMYISSKEAYCIGLSVLAILGIMAGYTQVITPFRVEYDYPDEQQLEEFIHDNPLKEQLRAQLMSESAELGPQESFGPDPSEASLEQQFTERKFAELEDIAEDAQGRKPRLPQCILIGERKTGTTALLHFLLRHPQLKAPKKEVHFFDLNANYREGLKWYVDKMPKTNSSEVTFEKSPRYFRSPWVPQRMHEILPDVKLMLSVRDPILRAVSDFHFSLEANWSGGFDKTLHNSFDGYALQKGAIDVDFPPIARSVYALSLENWFKFFDRSQFYIFDGDSFIHENPVLQLQKIEKFIGLDPYFTKEMFFKSITRGFWCLRDPGCIFFGGKPHTDLKPKTQKKIKDFFQPYNKQFYSMIGYDFGWS